METGPLMDVNLLKLMAVLLPVVAATLPTLPTWWYVSPSELINSIIEFILVGSKLCLSISMLNLNSLTV